MNMYSGRSRKRYQPDLSTQDECIYVVYSTYIKQLCGLWLYSLQTITESFGSEQVSTSSLTLLLTAF